MRPLSIILVALLPAACTSAPATSTQGQLITCTTQPGTGVILDCVPGGGSGSGSGSGTCQDVDEDGDGEPHDVDDDQPQMTSSDDDDGDGISNENDCDEHEGEDGDDSGGGDSGIDLPYDVKPQLGTMATPIADAFAENGGSQPTAILSVTMDGGGDWRLTELQAGTSFLVTQDDCDHVGNRDIGRDRVIVTWQNTDGSTASDHLDIRYCDH